jgi:hypothetical protein
LPALALLACPITAKTPVSADWRALGLSDAFVPNVVSAMLVEAISRWLEQGNAEYTQWGGRSVRAARLRMLQRGEHVRVNANSVTFKRTTVLTAVDVVCQSLVERADAAPEVATGYISCGIPPGCLRWLQTE